MAKLVIDYIREKQGIDLNTLVDKDFSQFSWLIEVEPTKDIKGQRVSKSYYAYPNLGIKAKTKYIIKGKETESGLKEAIRITYHKMYETVNGIENVFVGVYKNFHWIDWAGNIGATKSDKPYYFTLEPVFIGDGTNTLVGFSSPKMRSMMKEERYSADDYLQAKNPDLYALIYGNYKDEYSAYLSTGKKDALVTAIENESNEQISEILNKEVLGLEPLTIKELILMNLQ